MTKQTLANGAMLNEETFKDFRQRLKNHYCGKSSMEHCYAKPVFVVYNTFLSKNDTEEVSFAFVTKKTIPKNCKFEKDNTVLTTEEFFNSIDKADAVKLDNYCYSHLKTSWLFSTEKLQQESLSKIFPEYRIEYLKIETSDYFQHFTREAAEAYIAKHKHRYPALAIRVESANYAWEYNAIIQGILSGEIQYVKP